VWLDGKDDAVQLAEVNTDRSAMAWAVRFPGVGDHGMHETMGERQPGRPHRYSHGREKDPTTERREAGPIAGGESDRFVIPVMAGNAAGGKEATHGRAL
jgi:hypothetical protein